MNKINYIKITLNPPAPITPKWVYDNSLSAKLFLHNLKIWHQTDKHYPLLPSNYVRCWQKDRKPVRLLTHFLNLALSLRRALGTNGLNLNDVPLCNEHVPYSSLKCILCIYLINNIYIMSLDILHLWKLFSKKFTRLRIPIEYNIGFLTLQ